MGYVKRRSKGAHRCRTTGGNFALLPTAASRLHPSFRRRNTSNALRNEGNYQQGLDRQCRKIS